MCSMQTTTNKKMMQYTRHIVVYHLSKYNSEKQLCAGKSIKRNIFDCDKTKFMSGSGGHESMSVGMCICSGSPTTYWRYDAMFH